MDGKIAKAGVDFDSYQELETMLKKESYDLIGLRSMTCFADFLHESVAKIREYNYMGPIIVGGPYPSSEYSIALRDPNITLAVIGEGEQPLLDLVKAMLVNNKKLPDWKVLTHIPGLAFREV